MTAKLSNRLLSLDVLRGISIIGMILVNNPGEWNGETIYAPLQHAHWNGLTPTDLIFPFFMFIMGISTYISMSKYNFEFNKTRLFTILKRTSVIFLIGIALAWLGLTFDIYNKLSSDELSFGKRLWCSMTEFENLRILGVLQRLALSYGATALIAMFVKHRYIPYAIATGLITYFLILLFGNGFEQNESNILSIVDVAILGKNHMFYDSGIEPEGIMSTIPSICHVLIGFMCGQIIVKQKDNKEKMLQLFIIGTILTFAGFLLSYGCPINKKIWSPTYALVTCGLAASFLSLLIWIIDVKGNKKWSKPFEVFGVNPLFIYVIANVLAILFNSIWFNYNAKLINIKIIIYNETFYELLGAKLASLMYALTLISCCWVIAQILYKKKIFIKI